MYFVHDSVGIFDPKKKIYRTNWSLYRMKGVADILGIFDGKPLAIEVKSKTGRLTPEQAAFLARWKSMGGIGIVARSIEDVRSALEQHQGGLCPSA